MIYILPALIAGFVLLCVAVGLSSRPKNGHRETRRQYTASGHRDQVQVDGSWANTGATYNVRIRHHNSQ